MMNRTFVAAAIASVVCTTTTAAGQRQLLWGDTHLHSSNSVGAYLTGNASADLETAYRFAKRLPVIHPGHRGLVQIGTPLDFLVMADHAEFLGGVRFVMERGVPGDELGMLGKIAAWAGEWWRSQPPPRRLYQCGRERRGEVFSLRFYGQ